MTTVTTMLMPRGILRLQNYEEPQPFISSFGIHALGYNITLLAGQFEGSYVLILHCPKPRISARHLQRGAG